MFSLFYDMCNFLSHVAITNQCEFHLGSPFPFMYGMMSRLCKRATAGSTDDDSARKLMLISVAPREIILTAMSALSKIVKIFFKMCETPTMPSPINEIIPMFLLILTLANTDRS